MAQAEETTAAAPISPRINFMSVPGLVVKRDDVGSAGHYFSKSQILR